MIQDDLAQSSLYEPLHPGFRPAFEYLRGIGAEAPPEGRVSIDGDRLYALISRNQGKGKAGTRLETHNKYIDIQYTFSGTEQIGWTARQTLAQSSEGYDALKDIEFYAGKPESWATVTAGCFAIFFPSDAHAPLATEGTVFKIVVKVAVDW